MDRHTRVAGRTGTAGSHEGVVAASTADGTECCIDLEKWVRFDVCCPEATNAMREWETTLRDAYISPNSRRYHRKVPLRAVLVPIFPLIAELVNLDRRTEIRQHLMRVAPPSDYEQIPEEYMEHCYEARMLLCGVIER